MNYCIWPFNTIYFFSPIFKKSVLTMLRVFFFKSTKIKSGLLYVPIIIHKVCGVLPYKNPIQNIFWLINYPVGKIRWIPDVP